jgi:hypothetical protein
MKPSSTAAIRKADWMARFSDAVVALAPQHAGRIVWADATHLFNSGYTPGHAAERYVAAQKVSRNL